MDVYSKIRKESRADAMNSEKPEILMVDDDEITLDVMKAFLKKGYNLETVTKLQEAMTKIHAKRYDVILLYINLGKGITGVEKYA